MTKSTSPYPAEPWRIREVSFDPSLLVRNETIFALANGTLGLRGSFEEGRPAGVPGTYINGFYEQTPIVYGEIAHAYARNRQVMLNVASGTGIVPAIGGEPLDLTTGTILSYERCLDLRTGILSRSVRWRSPAGVEVLLETRRLVSFARPAIAAIEWRLTLPRRGASVLVESTLEGDVANQSSSSDPRIGAHFPSPPLVTTGCRAEGTRLKLVQETRVTRRVLACAAEHVIDAGGAVAATAGGSPGAAEHVVESGDSDAGARHVDPSRAVSPAAGKPAGGGGSGAGGAPPHGAVPMTVTATCSPSRAALQIDARMPAGATLRITKVIAYVAAPGKVGGELTEGGKSAAARGG
ncbi:MAG TPA: hypothetical protein VHE79_10785, partial [Spirochaetia bacterium]